MFPENDWWLEMAEMDSFYEFAEREMGFEDAQEEIMGDEDGWGAWMGGEL